MRLSARVLSTVVVVVAAFLAACGAKAPPATAQAHGAQGKQYRFDIQAEPVKQGQSGKIVLFVRPAKGFHWNKEYPATLSLTPPGDGALKLKQSEFDRSGFKPEGDAAKVVIDYEALKAGRTLVTGTANFSVCNDETCLLYRSEQVTIPVVVR